MTIVTITPSGTTDDSNKIQTNLNGLSSGDTIQLNGVFKLLKTVYIPSNIIWILNGSIKVNTSSGLDTVDGWKTAITQKSEGAVNFSMSGGIYTGNGKITGTGALLNFTHTVNSTFSDIIVELTDHAFILDVSSNGNTCNSVLTKDSINGLGDRGNNNTWNDCIAENCNSDCFIIKCRNSVFNRCIGRNSISAVGFGAYAKIDGVTAGANISGNKFNACEAYGNAHSGFSLNCPTNGPNARIENNFIQMKIYDNCKKQDVTTLAGLFFRNKLSSSILRNNTIDVLTYNNGPKGGLAFEATFPITGNTGNLVCYGNSPYDIDISTGTGNTFTLHQPSDKPSAKINKGNNIVNIKNFTCPVALSDPFCERTYCGITPIHKFNVIDIQSLNEIEGVLALRDDMSTYDQSQACQYICQKLREI